MRVWTAVCLLRASLKVVHRRRLGESSVERLFELLHLVDLREERAALGWRELVCAHAGQEIGEDDIYFGQDVEATEETRRGLCAPVEAVLGDVVVIELSWHGRLTKVEPHRDGKVAEEREVLLGRVHDPQESAAHLDLDHAEARGSH